MQHLNRSSVVESMKGAKWISCGLALGLVSASAVWSSCNKEPQPEGRTALEHAYECEEVLGPLPRFFLRGCGASACDKEWHSPHGGASR